MDWGYRVALFVHVLAAISLVGSTVGEHLTQRLLPRARTVDGARSLAVWWHGVGKATVPAAVLTLLAGLYLAFAGDWWGAGWPGISLGLFAVAAAVSGGMLDPACERLRTLLEQEPDGPMDDDLRHRMADPSLVRASALLLGVDVAIVLLMTAKPGWVVAGVIGAAGLAGGAGLGALEVGRHRQPATA